MHARLFSFLLVFSGTVMISYAQPVPRCEMQMPNVLSSTQAQVSLQLVVWYTQEIKEVNPPRLTDFEIVRGPIRETGSETRDGLHIRYQVIRYQLRPLHEGVLHLNGFTAVADGKSIQSKEVHVRVGDPDSPGATPDNPVPDMDACLIRRGESAATKIPGKLLLKLEASKPSVYIGEPLLLQYKLYSQLMSESSVSKNSSLSGFSVMDLLPPGETPIISEMLNGRKCPVYLLRKAQVFPLQSGTLQADALETSNSLRFLKEDWLRQQPQDRQSLLEAFVAETVPAAAVYQEEIQMKSNALSVLVKPLPDSGKPLSFSGAVGNMVVHSGLSRRSYYLGEPVEWVIAISGSGNLQLVPPPGISWAGGIPQVEPVTRDSFNAQEVPLTGIRSFSYTLLPDSAGGYVLPSVLFSYFNPAEARYHELRTDTIQFTVLSARVSTGKPELVRGESASGSAWIFTHRWVLLIPLVLLVVSGVVWYSRNSRPAQNTSLEEPASATNLENGFEQSERALQESDSRAFYRVLEEELMQQLKQYAGAGNSWISRTALFDQLQRSGLSAEFTEELKTLFNHIDQQRYSPLAEDRNMAATYAQAKQLLQTLSS